MAEDNLFQEAIEALRRGEKSKAKDMLTELIKDNQRDVQYWIWLSAAVESTREQTYCLQTALRLDPDNTTARRGLVLLGALPPDEDVQPFSLDRPRHWDEKLALATDKPKEKKSIRAVMANPMVRLSGLGVVGIAVLSFVVFGLVLPRNTFSLRRTNTPGPSPTFTLTPTFINAPGGIKPVVGTLVPLAELLEVPHTVTPLYVNTPREPISMDNYRVVKNAYEQQDWDTVISGMRDIADIEPDAADPYYYIGEAYRFKGDHRNALEAYNQALRINPDFGPPYLGLARARLIQDPKANIEQLFEEAIKRDPNFGEVYLERAIYYLNRQKPDLALADLTTAERLMPGSPLVFYYQARAHLVLENYDEALEAALEANEADVTMLSAYFTLGEIYMAQGEYVDAVNVLNTYTGYESRSATAHAMLGEAYYEVGDCESAIEVLGRSISLDIRQRRAYLIRGLCYVETEQPDQAESDLNRISQYYKESFELNLGLMRTYIQQEHFGDAYLQGERVLAFAETDKEKGLAYYWRALNFEYREEPKNAADSWQLLLELPRTATTREMRAIATEHLYGIRTPTPTTTVTQTQTPEATITRTPTKTKTPTPTSSPTE